MLNREQIIEQIKANIAYYQSHTTAKCTYDDGTINPYPTFHAEACVDALAEILKMAEEYDQVYDSTKQTYEST